MWKQDGRSKERGKMKIQNSIVYCNASVDVFFKTIREKSVS